jgi:hypothetical protein
MFYHYLALEIQVILANANIYKSMHWSANRVLHELGEFKDNAQRNVMDIPSCVHHSILDRVHSTDADNGDDVGRNLTCRSKSHHKYNVEHATYNNINPF